MLNILLGLCRKQQPWTNLLNKLNMFLVSWLVRVKTCLSTLKWKWWVYIGLEEYNQAAISPQEYLVLEQFKTEGGGNDKSWRIECNAKKPWEQYRVMWDVSSYCSHRRNLKKSAGQVQWGAATWSHRIRHWWFRKKQCSEVTSVTVARETHTQNGWGLGLRQVMCSGGGNCQDRDGEGDERREPWTLREPPSPGSLHLLLLALCRANDSTREGIRPGRIARSRESTTATLLTLELECRAVERERVVVSGAVLACVQTTLLERSFDHKPKSVNRHRPEIKNKKKNCLAKLNSDALSRVSILQLQINVLHPLPPPQNQIDNLAAGG